jgi:mono/diheme cytochrome c family protein
MPAVKFSAVKFVVTIRRAAFALGLGVLAVGLAGVASIARAADSKNVSYEDDVKPILRQHCFKCHGEDEQKSDLNLQSYATLLKGGSGGEVVKAGRPSGSVLYQAIAHEGDATPMPPNRPRIADVQLAIVRLWIEQGLRETASSESAAAKRRSLEFTPLASGRPTGPPPMPAELPALNLPALLRPHPVTALAASPWAPLLAVAGHERVLLYNTDTHAQVGGLAFAEGIPYVLRFSRDGAVLLAAGGRPVQAGKAVLWDVKSGKRLAEIGDENDSILAADLSPDQEIVAIGGTGKVVKVFGTRDGKLHYKLAKHTDWITALEFSPDGTRLATADRNGAVHLWEAKTGGIVLSLSEHKDSVAALNWRGDSQMLATGGEDGKLILWDAQDGWPTATIGGPHVPKPTTKTYGKLPGGLLALQFAPDGRLVTSGRDRFVRLWDPAGKPLAAFETAAALPTKVAASYDGRTVIAGDSAGEVHFWSVPPAGTK